MTPQMIKDNYLNPAPKNGSSDKYFDAILGETVTVEELREQYSTSDVQILSLENPILADGFSSSRLNVVTDRNDKIRDIYFG